MIEVEACGGKGGPSSPESSSTPKNPDVCACEY